MGPKGETPITNNQGENYWSHLVRQLEYSARVNSGYRVEIKLRDPGFELLSGLEKKGFFLDIRRRPLVVKFVLSQSDQFDPDESTPERTAIVTGTEAGSPVGFDEAFFTLVAIDPPSFFLNIGDAGGGVFTGKLEDAINKMVKKYAPLIEFSMGETDTAKDNKYWMMRMNPKAFMGSLLSWATAVSKKRTRWLLMPEDYKLRIQEQADFEPSVKGYYLKMVEKTEGDTVRAWAVKANNFLTCMHTKLVTSGLSATTGEYLDRKMDKKEEFVFVKDTNTPGKIVAETLPIFTFDKPPDGIGSGSADGDRTQSIVGWSPIISEPELYSAGEIGRPYKKYVSGQARGTYLGLLDGVMNLTIEVPGHHIWGSTVGLGSDLASIVFEMSGGGFYFISGKWVVNGFRHVWVSTVWHTFLDLTRIDADATGKSTAMQGPEAAPSIPSSAVEGVA